MNLLHLVLSAATCLASFQLFHASIRLSFSIVDRHVVFGRPTFLLPSGVQVSAVSQLLFFSICRIYPTHFHLLNLTSVLIVFNFVFARISRFDTTYGHRICRIRLKHLKKNYKRSELLWHDMTHTWMYIISSMMFLTNFLSVEEKIILRNKVEFANFYCVKK